MGSASLGSPGVWWGCVNDNLRNPVSSLPDCCDGSHHHLCAASPWGTSLLRMANPDSPGRERRNAHAMPILRHDRAHKSTDSFPGYSCIWLWGHHYREEGHAVQSTLQLPETGVDGNASIIAGRRYTHGTHKALAQNALCGLFRLLDGRRA